MSTNRNASTCVPGEPIERTTARAEPVPQPAGSGMALWACPDHLAGPNGAAAGG